MQLALANGQLVGLSALDLVQNQGRSFCFHNASMCLDFAST